MAHKNTLNGSWAAKKSVFDPLILLLMYIIRLPDNCAPYVIIYTGAQLSGSGAQLSGPGAQLSGPGAQLMAILVCIPFSFFFGLVTRGGGLPQRA